MFFKKYILNLSLTKAIRYRDRKLSKIISESFREDINQLFKKYPDDQESLENLKKQLISKKDHLDYLDVKKSKKFSTQKKEMIAVNIKILGKLIDLIKVIQPPSSIGAITSTEIYLNSLKNSIQSRTPGALHLYRLIHLNRKFDANDLGHEFRAIYRNYTSSGKPFPLN